MERAQQGRNSDVEKVRREKDARKEMEKVFQRWRKSRREKMQVREKVGKSRNTVFFHVFCGSGGSKGRLAKAAGAEVHFGQMRDEKVHAVVARSTF